MHCASKLTSVEGKSIKIEIWDAPTSNHLAPLVKCKDQTAYYASVKAFLVVFDLSSPASLEFALKCNHELPQKSHRVLVGNKSDLAQTAQRHHAKEEARLADASYIETSAKTGYNIDSLFVDLASHC